MFKKLVKADDNKNGPVEKKEYSEFDVMSESDDEG